MSKQSKPQIKKGERGQAALEMVGIMTLMVFFFAFVVQIGPYYKIKLATRSAAYDCAFQAAQSLNKQQGYSQGVVTAQETFRAYGLTYEYASISIRGTWERNGQVACTVGYSVPLENLPLKLVANVPAQVNSTFVLPVQAYKSKWN